jgi:hypothetical protein
MHRKKERRVRDDCSLTRAVTQMLFPSGNHIPGKTYAKECCTDTFASFSSPRMSSSGY